MIHEIIASVACGMEREKEGHINLHDDMTDEGSHMDMLRHRKTKHLVVEYQC